MVVAVVILVLVVVILLADRLLMHKEIKRISNQIETMSEDNSNCTLMVEMPNPVIADLAAAVNKLQQQHRDQTAQYIRQSEEMKQSMADISHDLRTPLTALIGYVNLLRKGENNQEKQKEYLNIVYDKAGTLHKLVSSLFELARLECGAYPFEWETIEIREVLGQELAAFYPQFMHSGIEPDVHIEDINMFIRGDRTAVQRIFNNLIQNTLTHGAGAIRIQAVRKQDKVRFEISNAAPDLGPAQVKEIFRKAYTADPVRTKKGGGLGLAIAKEFTEKMQGTIQAGLKDGRLSICIEFPEQSLEAAERER